MVKKWILNNLESLFGNIGASIDVDILFCSSSSKTAKLRVASYAYHMVSSSIILSTSFENLPCFVQISKSSSILIALADNDTNFNVNDFIKIN